MKVEVRLRGSVDAEGHSAVADNRDRAVEAQRQRVSESSTRGLCLLSILCNDGSTALPFYAVSNYISN